MTISLAAQEAIERARKKIVDRDANPLLKSLPDWVSEYRPHQTDAMARILDAYTRVPVVVLSAPTGSGKTLLGETVRRMLEVPALYICTSKSLQDQFLRDYDYAEVLKGRANYPTRNYPELFGDDINHVSCDDCEWSQSKACRWCTVKSDCPYEIQKQRTLRSPIAVLNTSYFLAEANNVGRFSDRPLVIADEADELESALMGYVSIEISEGRLRRWNWQPPEKLTVKESWEEWLVEKIARLSSMYGRLDADNPDVKVQRERKYIANTAEKMKLVLNGLSTDAWVYTGRAVDDKKGRQGVSFKPARVDFLGHEMLWKHSPRWLLMSATVISSQEMLESLGYRGNYETVEVANTFPIENRKIIVRPAANMAAKNAEASWPKVGAALAKIVTENPEHRILVHSVSYKLTEFLVGYLVGGTHGATISRNVYSYQSADGREPALSRFKKTECAVLLGPSLDRGVDLPGDLCRVQVIVKVPYGNIGDKQVVTRLYSRGGKVWYAVQTIRKLVQSSGRAVRSKDDWAKTYILDSQFKDRLWNEGRGLFPRWFVDAIQWKE